LTTELCKSDAGGGCGGSSQRRFITEGLTMKSKLSAALAATVCILAVSVGAAKADIITLNVVAPVRFR
jgi:hypothetical protein